MTPAAARRRILGALLLLLLCLALGFVLMLAGRVGMDLLYGTSVY